MQLGLEEGKGDGERERMEEGKGEGEGDGEGVGDWNVVQNNGMPLPLPSPSPKHQSFEGVTDTIRGETRGQSSTSRAARAFPYHTAGGRCAGGEST